MSSIWLNSLLIKNYRSFGERQSFVFPNQDYGKPVAIIGYNNAGKSNMLKAIKFALFDSVREDTFDLVDFHNMDWNNAPCFQAAFMVDIIDDRLNPQVVYKNTVITNVENSLIQSVEDYCNCYGEQNKQYSKKWAIKQKAPIYFINFHNIRDEISTHKTSWGNLKSFLGKHIQKIVDLDNIMKEKKSSFQEGVKGATDEVLENSQLQSFISSIQKNYQKNLRNTDCVVDFGLPHYEDIFLKMLFKIGLNGNMNSLIPIDHFGDGFISMFVMAVIQAIAETSIDDRCLFLFEEPESFLHENHQEYFYKVVLCGLAKNGHQVIYTTHSDRMIDAFDTQGIIRLELDDQNQTVKMYNSINSVNYPANAINDDAELEEPISIERYNEYVKTVEPNLNRMLFSKKVLLVEGPNDVMVYKYVIRQKVLNMIQNREDIGNPEKFADTYLNYENISFVCHHGKTTALYIIELCRHFNVDYFVITDWDFKDDELDQQAVLEFTSLDQLHASDLYNEAERKGGVTNNWNLFTKVGSENIHFNTRKLETVIGYARDDKNSFKIWNHINNEDFTIPIALYPDSLNSFLNIDVLAEVIANNEDDGLPF
ncbi:ATP-dependent nuclease [Sphingobacterium faecium]|uniref:ATP-dependent nuclease n=1 Tax=Sphingobacterium faecium TaxID=34087 RepID=UPI00247A3512|nr:AAA family ATPase [Sphingobacterium faecium]WGQ14760.1 AAA family ATPase [Sphingobacterium faecium]